MLSGVDSIRKLYRYSFHASSKAYILFLAQCPRFADEVLAEFDEAFRACSDQRDLVGQFRAPGMIGFLQTQAIHGVGAEQHQAVWFAGALQAFERYRHLSHRRVQLPTQFADVVNAQRTQCYICDCYLIAGQPSERRAGKIGISAAPKYIPRAWPGEDEDCIVQLGRIA